MVELGLVDGFHGHTGQQRGPLVRRYFRPSEVDRLVSDPAIMTAEMKSQFRAVTNLGRQKFRTPDL